MPNTNPNFSYFTSSNEVRALLASKGYAKTGTTKSVQGRWSNGSREIHIGMCLAPAHRTGQSSTGGANWVYSVPKAV